MSSPEPRPTIFEARNHHVESAGEPPHITADRKGRYCGYYENEHGEQFIFVYERATKQATLWMGDYGWGNSISVVDGNTPEVVLSEHERMWLRSCWLAAIAPE